MILRLIFALAFILTGAELAAIDTAVAAGSGFGIQLSINGPKEPNTDRPGGDIRNFEIFGSIGGLGVAEDACQSACVQNSSCRAWTLVKPGIQGPNARCWLKSAVPGKVSNNCCTSGVER